MSNEIKYKIGCYSILFLIILVIGLNIRNFIFDKESSSNKLNKNEMFETYWNSSNILFFKHFNCKSLVYKEKKVSVTKAFIIESHNKELCDIKKIFKFHYIFPDTKYRNKITDSIEKANVLIWINEIEPEREGRYTDGSIAKRKRLEMKFIDLKSQDIYKKTIINFDGEAQDEIERRAYSKPYPVVFGEYPQKKIIIEIKKVLDE